MAFVGFKTEADATKALEYFDNTFVDTSKIAVEYARAMKSSALPRPWSRHSEGSSAHAKATKPKPDAKAPPEADPDRFIGVRELKKMKKAKQREYEAELDRQIAEDPKLAEFMRLMMPRSKQKLWDNQDAGMHLDSAVVAGEDDGGAGFEDGGESDDDYQDVGGESEEEEEEEDDDDAGGARGPGKKGETGTPRGGGGGKNTKNAKKKKKGREVESESESESEEDDDDDDLSGEEDEDAEVDAISTTAVFPAIEPYAASRVIAARRAPLPARF